MENEPIDEALVRRVVDAVLAELPALLVPPAPAPEPPDAKALYETMQVMSGRSRRGYGG